MKNVSVVGLVMFFCLVFIGEACAKFPLQNQTSAGELLSVSKTFNITGKVQIFLNGHDWRFSSLESGLRVWVLEKNNFPSTKNNWRLLKENEETSGDFAVVRIEIGDNGYGTVRANGLIDTGVKQKGVVLGFAEICLLAGCDLMESDKFESLMDEKISYELVTPKENSVTLMEYIAQEIIRNIVPGKALYGFVVQDSGGFLGDIIKVDQGKIKQDSEYAAKIFKKAAIEDHQFVIAIFENLKP